MPYRISAKLNREDWMTLPETVAHICAAQGQEEKLARRELVKALAKGLRPLGPLKWERERNDKAAPFGFSSIMAPMDTPPIGRAWEKARIRWKTGRVRNDWGEYKPGKWRTLLIIRHNVLRNWPLPSSDDPTPAEPNPDLSNVVSTRKRGRSPGVSEKVKGLMREDLRKGELTRDDLFQMKEEAMATRYRASRDTCRKVRSCILSESRIVENSPGRNSDK
jgi:hypothetical protein